MAMGFLLPDWFGIAVRHAGLQLRRLLCRLMLSTTIVVVNNNLPLKPARQ
jgi:hypothetical protein